MKLYVALMADARGYYCHVHGKAMSWDEFHNQLEDLGVEFQLEEQALILADLLQLGAVLHQGRPGDGLVAVQVAEVGAGEILAQRR